MTVLRRKLRQRITWFVGVSGVLSTLFWLFLIVKVHISAKLDSVESGHPPQSAGTKPAQPDRRTLHSKALENEVQLIMNRTVPNPVLYAREFKSNLSRAPGCAKCIPECPRCNPRESNALIGDLRPYIPNTTTLEEIIIKNPNVLRGGQYSPKGCATRDSVAIIIPFRDRWKQVRILLDVLHPMLQRQLVCYRIFLIEQYGCQAFNKGRLNNAGFLEVAKLFRFDCVIFQDTDIIPEHDGNLYNCPTGRPRHMAVAVDVHRYRLPYNALVGGVIAFTVDHYLNINGYSNLYWGWGLEDDDMELRMKIGTKLRYVRPAAKVARYRALPHKPQHIFSIQGARRKPLLTTVVKRFRKDGLNTVTYHVMFVKEEPLFTHIMLNIGDQPEDFYAD